MGFVGGIESVFQRPAGSISRYFGGEDDYGTEAEEGRAEVFRMEQSFDTPDICNSLL